MKFVILLSLLISSKALALLYTPDICKPTALRAAEHHYASACMFTAMRLCSERLPIGPNNRYDCYNSNLTICELEAQVYKKYLDQK